MLCTTAINTSNTSRTQTGAVRIASRIVSYRIVYRIPWKSHLMSHLKTSAISCAVQPTASRPAQMAPALLPANRLMLVSMPLSSSACTDVRHTEER